MSDKTSFNLNSYPLLVFDWEGTISINFNGLLDGVMNTLTTLKQKGFTLYIATSASIGCMQEQFEKCPELRILFEGFQTSDMGPAKPDPAMLEEILLKTGFEKEQALMIGDSVYDVMMGNLAKVDAIGLLSGSSTATNFETVSPKCVLTNINELLNYL